MVLTRSRQRKDVKATTTDACVDKPRKSGEKDEDSVTQNISLKTRKAIPNKHDKAKQSEQTSPTVSEEVKPQPDSTESLPAPQKDVRKDEVVIATTYKELPIKKSPKKRNRKRKSGDGQTKSPKIESQSEVKLKQDAPTNLKVKGETLTNSSPAHSVSSSSSVKQKSNIKTNLKKGTVTVRCTKRAKKDERTAVDEEVVQKENASSTVEKKKPLTEEKTEVNAKEIMKMYKKESFIGELTKHKGNPKSGRKWKTEQTSRSSGMKQDKPMRSSWKKKMAQKAEKKSMKLFEAELKEARTKELEKKKQHRANKIKLKLENERKSEVVQVINNTAKLKRMKKKQLRKVEMRKIPNFNTAQIFA